MLIQKIAKARRREEKIERTLSNIGEYDYADKDVALFQFFILEQFTAFKRFVLKVQFFAFPATTPLPISLYIWVGAWAFILLSIAFYLYWILTWAGKFKNL